MPLLDQSKLIKWRKVTDKHTLCGVVIGIAGPFICSVCIITLKGLFASALQIPGNYL